MHVLLICRTCPRGQQTSEEPSVVLARQLGERCDSLGMELLRVNCLGACRQPCAVALDAPDKPRLRFSGLRASEDAASLDELIVAYRQSVTGDPTSLAIPAALRSALSAVSPKLRPSASPSPSIGVAQTLQKPVQHEASV